MFCPKCKSDAVQEKSPNGGSLYVAEEFDSCTECYDSLIEIFQCTGCHFTFYAEPDK